MSVKIERHKGQRFVVDFLGDVVGIRIRESYCMREGRALEFKLLTVYWSSQDAQVVEPYNGSLIDTVWLKDLREVLREVEAFLRKNCKGSSELGWRLGGPRPV